MPHGLVLAVDPVVFTNVGLEPPDSQVLFFFRQPAGGSRKIREDEDGDDSANDLEKKKQNQFSFFFFLPPPPCFFSLPRKEASRERVRKLASTYRNDALQQKKPLPRGQARHTRHAIHDPCSNEPAKRARQQRPRVQQRDA